MPQSDVAQTVEVRLAVPVPSQLPRQDRAETTAVPARARHVVAFTSALDADDLVIARDAVATTFARRPLSMSN
jgi:hypothetical protein